MALIYITGAPGSGKSTIQHGLTRLGHIAYDLDDSRFGGPFNKASNLPAVMPPLEKRTPEWFDAHEWRVSREAVSQLKQDSSGTVVYLCGTATTEDAIIDIFDKVIYLNVNEQTLRDRIANRKENDFGKSPHELERILARFHEAQATLSSNNYEIIDANGTLEDTIQKILAIA